MCPGKAPKTPFQLDEVVDTNQADFVGLSIVSRIKKLIIRRYARHFHYWTKIALSPGDWETLLSVLDTLNPKSYEIMITEDMPVIKLLTAPGFVDVIADPSLESLQIKLKECKHA